MSSTSVHSNQNKHIVGGQTIPREPDENLEMPPQAAGKGPSVYDVREGREGERAEIPTQPNIVVKDGKEVVGRATMDGQQVLTGDGNAVRKAIEEANKANRTQNDIGR